MRAAAQTGLPAGTTVQVTGHDPLEEASTNGDSGGPSVLLEAVVGGLGALVILLFVFGTLPAVLMPIVVAVAAILNTFTLVWGLTYITDVSIIVQFLIALVGLGVAIDYALLMIFRFRDELREGEDVETALVETMTHAGRSVIVSGTTVAVGLLSLIVIPLPFIRSMGIGGMLIPLVSVITAITLLPAMLAVLGERINSVARDAEAPCRPRPSRGRRLGPLGAVRAAAPMAGRRRRAADRRRLAGLGTAAQPERGAAEELPRQRHGDRRPADARRRRHQPGRDEAVRRPRRERRRPEAVAAKVSEVPGRRRRVRARRLAARPRLARRGVPVDRRRRTRDPGRSSTASNDTSQGPTATLGGVPAVDRDFVHAIYGNFPYVLAFVLILTLILLARAFRSIVLPIKAVLLNLLSLAAAFGIVVFIFQEGHGSSLWNITATQAITGLDPADDLRLPVRALDGLRGLHALAHARGLRRDRARRTRRSSSASPAPASS